ncbi:hypothetical protein NADE_003281 [Nannochloris sp. 'desiccata']|nr:hypothetical protein NADE_003281 [Chlorella desiccata (nom. nud.)]
MFSGLDVPSNVALLLRAPGFQTSRIPLRLQDKCASKHRHASLFHRRHLGGVRLLGGLMLHHPVSLAGHLCLCASHTASVVVSEDKQRPPVPKQPPVPKHFQLFKILGLVAAGSMTFTLATSDMITAATAIIVPSLLWFVRTLFGLLNKLSIEIKGVSNDVAELVKSMHRLEVNTIREQAASEARSTKNLLFALEGKFPSTDPEIVSNASESAENASDSP